VVAHLKYFGPVIHIAVSLPIILERIARKPERGLAINPGQTIEDLYHERTKLYEAAADFTIEGGHEPAQSYAVTIARWLSEPA
jgi:shikimate kinase